VQSHIDEYIAKGYSVIENAPSNIGSTILVDAAAERVVKFSQDRAYDKFARYARDNPNSRLPKIFAHNEYDDDSFAVSNSWYTVTEMEYLERLTDDEASDVEAWIARLFAALRSGTQWDELVDDPLDLLDAIRQLRDCARSTGTCLDVLKASNYMARASEGARRVVVTDPFN